MRLIDADELKQQIAVWQRIDPYNMLSMAAGAVIGEVNKSPTVDAVPVVRCKDCKWYCQRTGCCNRNAGIWTDDDFCSYAEWRGYNATD